jgi:hypothetical protein
VLIKTAVALTALISLVGLEARAAEKPFQALLAPRPRPSLTLPRLLALGATVPNLPAHPRTAPAEAETRSLCPSCTAGGRPLVAANLVLTGFAAVTAGTGAVLAFATPKRGIFKGSLKLALTPTKAFASAVWRF